MNRLFQTALNKAGINRSQLLLYLFSFLIVASAQPDWSVSACVLASSLGYALFWFGLSKSRTIKKRFCAALFWFGGIQAIHLSWFMSDRYVGIYIFPFLFILFLGLSLQFALLCLLIKNPNELNITKILGISGLWALMEWGRLYLLSGYTWNPVGLALSSNLYSLQFASVFGVFGLSFWVFFTNFAALKWFVKPGRIPFCLFAILTICPYLFGFMQVTLHENLSQKYPAIQLNTLLVQTGLSPEEKMSLDGSTPIPPIDQWKRILTLIKDHLNKPIDLVVLPEGAVPYGTDIPIYRTEDALSLFNLYFGTSEAMPHVSAAFVGNSFIAGALARQLQADVVIGLEDADWEPGNPGYQVYNSAFLFPFQSQERHRYEKRILVPMGEYIPFNWCKSLLRKYGIHDSFLPGKEAKVFPGKKSPLGISICYEETYGHLMRESCKKGAGLLVNLTNDVWYPRSRLPIVHFLHGRLRAVEGGIPLVRACNTGVTCGVDSLGKTVGLLNYDSARNPPPAEALYLSIPLYKYPTFYTRYGDLPIVIFSICALALMTILFGVKKINLLVLNQLDIYPLRKNKK